MTRKPAKPGARRKSQQKGAQWERFVAEQWLKRLKAVGVLTAFHKLEPTKIGDRFTKDAGADFVCCTSSGRYLAIECKATDQDRFKRCTDLVTLANIHEKQGLLRQGNATAVNGKARSSKCSTEAKDVIGKLVLKGITKRHGQRSFTQPLLV